MACRTVATVHRRVICAVVVLAPAPVHADGIAIVGGSPRAIGRAGAATVGDDGGGALLVNPGVMARRDTARGQIGFAVVEDSLQWQSAGDAAPLSMAQAGSRLAPLGAAIGAVGPWILGAGMMTAAVSERSLARPPDDHRQFGAAYDYRYTGIAGSYRRDTLALGVARRLGDSLALGLSFGASRVRIAEHRRVWAGFVDRDAEMLGDPGSDVDLAFSGTDRFVPSAVAGLLYAPESTSIELGASVSWSQAVAIDGGVSAAGQPGGPAIESPAPPRAALAVAQPVTVRAGARYIGDRIVAELDGDLWIAPRAGESTGWSVHGVRVVDATDDAVDLSHVPSRISHHTHVALRTAVDLELIPGFLWAVGGYAFSTLGTPAERLSPSFGDLGGHTFGLGLEATAGGFTATLGWSRTWSRRTHAPTALRFDNPFAGGDGPVYPGAYDGTLDQIGVLLEGELTRLNDLLPR
jgi:hypothetical protein